MLQKARFLHCWLVDKLWLRSHSGITFGHLIFIRADYWPVPKWLEVHELTHAAQWGREGYLKFAMKYIYYHFRYGYKNNPYEVEARAADSLYREDNMKPREQGT